MNDGLDMHFALIIGRKRETRHGEIQTISDDD